MKTVFKYIAVLFSVSFYSLVIFPIHSHADTIILKNGRWIENVETWEEGGMVKCRRFGAVVGYPVQAVMEVKKAPLPSPSLPRHPKKSKSKSKMKSGSFPDNDSPLPSDDSNAGKFLLTRLYDGDSFKATDQNLEIYVRIIGIDAPETAKPAKNQPGQPYAEKAKSFVQNMLIDTAFHLKGYGTDRYKRQLAQVFIKGKDLGLELVRAGLAECYRGKASKGFDPAPYKQAEEEAKSRHIGIWSQGSAYVSPKKWRKMYQK